MKSINEASIICNNCNTHTTKTCIIKNGFQLRAWQCNNCNEQWIHPIDLAEYNKYNTMRQKQYAVKLRLVGNSYTVSIPREIIDFQENILKEINQMIKISLDSPERLTLYFSKKMEEELLK
ncbi:MAG: hypothetical protein Q8Q42_03775 [Nanoarchaeota archaeon]|nr:hypothetical protein [Nanoarchaeota archaeon]